MLLWDMLETTPLFPAFDVPAGEMYDAMHLAAMTALLGAPPPRFLANSDKCDKYWDCHGTSHAQHRFLLRTCLELTL